MKTMHINLVVKGFVPAYLLIFAAAPVHAVQFPSIDPNYTQEIYTAPLYTTTVPHEGGFAWNTAGNLLTRTANVVNVYSLTPTTNINSTLVRSTIANVAVPGLSTTGVGMTNGLDGYVYTATAFGLQRFDPNNLAAPAQNLTGTVGGNGWGITTLPDGRIAYSDGSGGAVYVYTPNANPTLGTNAHIYTGSSLIDGMVAGPGGNIAVANQPSNSITIMTSTGTPILTFSTGAHHPDGLAFASITSSTSTIYSNNNDGTVTKYLLTPGYTSLISAIDIAGVSGAYGDLAAVGPDCAFYVSQYENGGLNGSVAGTGTNWDNLTTTGQATYTRIALTTGGGNGTVGTEICGFYTPLEGANAPEPTSLAMLAVASISLMVRRRARAG